MILYIIHNKILSQLKMLWNVSSSNHFIQISTDNGILIPIFPNIQKYIPSLLYYWRVLPTYANIIPIRSA